MGRYRIELVTMTDCNNFVEAVSRCEGKIVLESGDGFRVNARSLIGALAAQSGIVYIAYQIMIFILLFKNG